MTLLDPDAGEILDRLSILARKRLEKPDRAHFETEERELVKFWREGPDKPIYGSLLPPLFRLAAVNMALWQTEDNARIARDMHKGFELFDAEGLVSRLQALNEERSRLIQFFNAELGRGAVEEKDFKL